MAEALISLVLLLILVAVITAIVRVVGRLVGLLRQPTPAAPTPQDALRKLRVELEKLTEIGVLDWEARDKLIGAIRTEEVRLLEKRLAREASVSHETRSMAAEPESSPQTTAGPAVPLPTSESVAPPPAAIVVPRPAPLSLAERAANYARSRASASAAFSDTGVPPAPLDLNASVPSVPREPAVPFSRLMAAFMEDKNIRWGELVGGLLIVGCSIALVISFWSEIAARPLLKFSLFNGVTAALFGVGLYTERRWKIHTTSHGLLVIATLLVPLNFLAIAAFTQQTPPRDALSLAGEGLSIIVFATLVYFAGVTLVPQDAWLLVIGVMLPSLMQLLVRRFAEPGTPLAWLYALAGVPIVGYLATTGAAMWQRWEAPSPNPLPEGEGYEETEANRVLVFLGLVSAATLLPLALLAFKVPPIEKTAHWLSPLIAPCGLPALLVGLWFWRSMTDRRLTGLQTAGIGVGALGALVMAGAVILAWPDPATLLPTALLTAVVLTAVAIMFGIPAAHVPAGVAFTAAWLIGFYLARGDVSWTLENYEPMKQSLISATSGHVLVPLVALFGGLAWWLSRSRWGATGSASALARGSLAEPVAPTMREHGKMYGLVAAGAAVASLALVLWFGWGLAGDTENATWTLAIYAIAAVAAATRLDRREVAWAAAVLALAAMLQGIMYRYGAAWELERPWVTALLAYAAMCAVGRAATRWMKPAAVHLRRALEWAGLGTSIAAAWLIVASAHVTSASALAVNLAWLAGVWLALAALTKWPVLFIGSQIAIVSAILSGVTAAVEGHAWYAAARHPWLDPWFLQAQGIALAGYCLVFGAMRWVAARIAKPPLGSEFGAERQVDETSTADWMDVERVVEGAIVILLLAVAIYAVVPGVAQELAPLEASRGAGPAVRVVTPIEHYELAGIAHAHAGDWGAWALLAAVGTALAAAVWQSGDVSRLQGLLISVAAVCPLLAVHWEPEVAVASALRWLLAGFFAALSAPIWWSQQKELPTRVEHAARDSLVAIVVLAYLAMGAYVFSAALSRFGMSAKVGWLWPYLLCWALVAGVAALLIPRAANVRVTAALHARDVLLLLAVGPIVILMTFAVAMALDQHPIVGPEPASWFRRIGWDWCYGVPLAVMALVFVGYAVRDRSSRFAFAAGLLMNVVATIALLVRLARGGGALDVTAWVTVAQVNAMVAGAVALVWLAAVAWERGGARGEERETGSESLAPRCSPLAPHWPWLLVTQAALAAALCCVFLLPGALGIALNPTQAGWVTQSNPVLGWAAVTLATIAAGWVNWRQGVGQNGVALLAAAVVAMSALTAGHWDTGNWLAFHTLLVGCCVAAWVVPWVILGANYLLGAEDAEAPAMKWSTLSVRLFAVAAVVLALRAVDDRPGMSWWRVWIPLAALVTISSRNVWIAWWERRRGFMWIAAVLLHLAVSIWWINHGFRLTGVPGVFESGSMLWVNVLAGALMTLVSVWIERTRILPAALALDDKPQRWRGIAFHRFASWAIVVGMFWMIGARLLNDLWGNVWPTNTPLAWAAWMAALVTAVACWWDPATRWPVACIYSVGLLAVGMFLDGLNFGPPMFQWALALALASYSLVTSALWSVRERLRAMVARLGAPPNTWEASGHGWLISVNLLIGIGVLALVWWIEISMEDFGQRMIAAYAIGAHSFALGLLARGAVRTSLQYLALVWGVLFAVAFGWAWLPPGFSSPWLHRLIVTVAALAVAVVVYGFGLVKFLRRENEWTRAAGRLVPVLAVVASALFVAVLGIEVAAFLQGRELHIAWPALLAVALALVGLIVAALAAALLPGRDPLGPSERGRTAYVYAAEALAALLFLHIRVTMPWLFSGWFKQFWPMIVMLIAFVGVGLGEVFQRRRQHVLSEPLQTTGALLPLLPALGFWFMSSQMFHVHYSLVLLSIGVLYAALSVLRESFWFAVLAGVAANGSLWYLLHTGEGLGLLEHPQLWLIPPALSALAAGYINRDRLSREQSTALRYAAAMVIYASSTADMFINGVADAPWLPAVLAGLSILGVLAGILLRVQSFLYLGTTFLVVALMTVIWHAAIEQQRTWILWVAGIVTGALIIAMFGLFEKRRDDVLRVVEQLKHWQA